MLKSNFSITAGLVILVLLTSFESVKAQNNNLTINPAKGYDVTSYNATIWLDRGKDSISGWVEMKATALGSLPEILQHAKFLQIDSVFVDGNRSQTTTPDSTGAYYITGYQNAYHNGSEFLTRTYYHGKGTNEGGSLAWGGVQNMGNMMFSMGVGFSAPYVSCTRHWLPCYDEPDDKADSVTLHFYADTAGGIVVSNGLQTAYKAGTDNGLTNYFEWQVSKPIATYLLTFAFGPFEKLSIANPLNIPFDVYAFAKDTAKARMVMEKRVVKALVFFDSLFGSYPFEKVGYVVAPIGSMEHQTMITLVNSALDTNNTTAVHELSHQWWGDRVTCYDFDEPWLNEGFATFCESLFIERFFGEKQYWTQQHSNISAALGASEDTIPLFGAPAHMRPRNNYPPVIYQKGAAVLGMLRYSLGDPAFFDALRNYGNQFAYSTATSEDLENIFEDTTHTDLRMFFIEWVYGIGHPQLSVTWSRNSTTVSMRLVQMQDSVRFGFFRQPIIVETRSPSQGKTERHEILLDTLRVTEVTFQNSFIPDTIVIDPDGAVLKKMTGAAKLGILQKQQNPNEERLFFVPNPSNRSAMMACYTGNNSGTKAAIEIFDSNGNKISTFRPDSYKIDPSTDNKEYFFDTTGLASGTYFASLVLNDQPIAKGELVISR